MAHGGKERLPTLRITFEELHGPLDTSSTKPNARDISSLNKHEEDENPGNRTGLFHLKHTTPMLGANAVNADKKKTKERPAAKNRSSSPPERRNYATTPEEPGIFLHSNPVPPHGNPGLTAAERRDHNPSFPDQTAKSTSNRHSRERNVDSHQMADNSASSNRRSRERNVNPSFPERMTRSTSHRQNRTRETLQSDGSRQRAQSEGGKKTLEGEELAREWSCYDHRRIERALSKWSGDVKKLNPILATCQGMQECAEKVLTQNLELFSKLDIRAKLWKTGHYQIIEALRRNGDEGVLGKFLVTSVEFYSRLPNILESKLDFRLSELTKNQVSFTSKTHLRMVMMAAMICHFWYICLGDLSRYQQQSLGSEADWSKPRRHYMWAHRLAPKDGKPYNQLALISISTHRRLDAVYYYMRALSVTPPFKSAYDSLVGIFEDTTRKAKRLEEDERMVKEREITRNRKREEQRSRKPHPPRRHYRNNKSKAMERKPEVQEFTSGRKEVWIMPGTTSGQEVVQVDHRVVVLPQEKAAASATSESVCNPGEDTLQQQQHQPLSQMTLKQAVKKMKSAFLIMQGKLFTRTDVETLECSMKKMLQCLKGLLKGEEMRLEYSVLFLKMMVISLFSIHNTVETHNDNQVTRSYYCSLTLSLTLRMVTALLNSCGKQMEKLVVIIIDSPPTSDGICKQLEDLKVGAKNCLPKHKLLSVLEGKDDDSRISQVLNFLSVLLPPVRILFDWFFHQKELYVQFLDTIAEPILHDFWTSTVTFLNLSSKIFPLHHHLSTSDDDDDLHATASPSLWEDRMLAGFIPLKENLGTKDTFSLPDFKGMTRKHHREQTIVRVKLISAFCRLLCDHDNSKEDTNWRRTPIRYNKQCHQFSTHFCVRGGDADDGDGGGGSEGGDESGDDGEGGGGDQEVTPVRGWEGDMTTSGEEEEDDMGLEIEVEDNSLSLGFSDSEDSVIEELSEDEAEGDTGMTANMGGGLGSKVEGVEVRGESPDEGNYQIEHLKAQREELARVIEERSKVMAVTKTVLSEAASKACEEVTITPKILVPDTNCFVDMLASLKTLINGAYFVVAVPLIVIAELEGLTKSLEIEKGQNTSKVAIGAKNALEYIRTTFGAKIPQIRALTTQGNLLSSLAFRAEVTGKASNDDLILESCLQLHLKTRASTNKSAGFYKVVLLTDDRNLRVKAHASSQPVKDIPGFMKLLQK